MRIVVVLMFSLVACYSEAQPPTLPYTPTWPVPKVDTPPGIRDFLREINEQSKKRSENPWEFPNQRTPLYFECHQDIVSFYYTDQELKSIDSVLFKNLERFRFDVDSSTLQKRLAFLDKASYLTLDERYEQFKLLCDSKQWADTVCDQIDHAVELASDYLSFASCMRRFAGEPSKYVFYNHNFLNCIDEYLSQAPIAINYLHFVFFKKFRSSSELDIFYSPRGKEEDCIAEWQFKPREEKLKWFRDNLNPGKPSLFQSPLYLPTGDQLLLDSLHRRWHLFYFDFPMQYRGIDTSCHNAYSKLADLYFAEEKIAKGKMDSSEAQLRQLADSIRVFEREIKEGERKLKDLAPIQLDIEKDSVHLLSLQADVKKADDQSRLYAHQKDSLNQLIQGMPFNCPDGERPENCRHTAIKRNYYYKILALRKQIMRLNENYFAVRDQKIVLMDSILILRQQVYAKADNYRTQLNTYQLQIKASNEKLKIFTGLRAAAQTGNHNLKKEYDILTTYWQKIYELEQNATAARYQCFCAGSYIDNIYVPGYKTRRPVKIPFPLRLPE